MKIKEQYSQKHILNDEELILHYQTIIKDEIEKRGITVAQLAILSDIGASTIHKLIHDKTRTCQFNNLYKIFSALNMPLSLIDKSEYINNINSYYDNDMMLPILKLKDLDVALDDQVFYSYKWTNFASCPSSLLPTAFCAIRKREFINLNDKLDPILIISKINNNDSLSYIEKNGGNYSFNQDQTDSTILHVIGEIDDV